MREVHFTIPKCLRDWLVFEMPRQERWLDGQLRGDPQLGHSVTLHFVVGSPCAVELRAALARLVKSKYEPRHLIARSALEDLDSQLDTPVVDRIAALA